MSVIVDLDPIRAEALTNDRLMVPRLHKIGARAVADVRARMTEEIKTTTNLLRPSVKYEVDSQKATLRYGSELLIFRFYELGTVHHRAFAPLRKNQEATEPEQMRIIQRG